MKVVLVIAHLLTHGESTAPKHHTGPADHKAAATAVIRKQGGSLSSWQAHGVEFNGASQLHKGSPGHKAPSTNEKTGATLAHVASRLHREAHVTQHGSSGTSGHSQVTQAAPAQHGWPGAGEVTIVSRPGNNSDWAKSLTPGQEVHLRQQYLLAKDQAWEPGVACIIPMWNRQDYVCKEYDSVSSKYIYADYRGNRRIFLPHRSDCTVECPRERWYQVPEIDVITCDNGVWRNPSGLLTPEVDCITSSEASNTALGIIVLASVCFCGGIVHCIRSSKNNRTMLKEDYAEQVKLYKEKFKQEAQEEEEKSMRASQAASRTASLNALSRSASQATLGTGLRRPSQEGVAVTQAPGSSSDIAAQEAPGSSSSDVAAQEAGPAGSAEEPVARDPSDPSQLALGTRPGQRKSLAKS